MSDLRQEFEHAIATLERQRTPLDREALKPIRKHLDALALRLKDVLDERDRYELGELHTRADALWKAAWHDVLFPTVLSAPDRSMPEASSLPNHDRPEVPDRAEPWGWDGFDR